MGPGAGIHKVNPCLTIAGEGFIQEVLTGCNPNPINYDSDKTRLGGSYQ
jgi:hypothetical protein